MPPRQRVGIVNLVIAGMLLRTQRQRKKSN
jgi:hypothetical protein